MLVKTYCAAVNGLDVTTVTIEVNLNRGVMYHFTGLGDAAVREGRDRIASALQYNGYKFPRADVTVNMAPADLRKEGSSFDLPLAIAILAAAGSIVSDGLDSYMMVGELSLDGSLQPAKGVLPIAIRARAEKFKGLIVPKQNVREAAVVNNLEVYGMENIRDVIAFLTGKERPEPTVIDTRREFYEQQYKFELDFADVRGQENVKRALEVAAAGGHNMIMIGPPGSGKSMMAKRLPSILPPLSLSESLETTQIHSVAGKLGRGTSLISQRPFRAPHHTISEVALVGGGVNPQPGEISLAHNGVLFADELPEFNKSTLEVLRQPLEDHKITISRAKYTTEFPCSFMFVASMNPCPCGYYGDPTHHCVYARTDTAVYEQNIGSAARPNRHTDGDNACSFQGHIEDSAGRAELCHTRAGHRRATHTGETVPPLQGSALQRADVRAHDTQLRRARHRGCGTPAHRHGASESVGTGIQPHTEGGAHHCRPCRERACHAGTSRRSHIIPQPRPGRLGGERIQLKGAPDDAARFLPLYGSAGTVSLKDILQWENSTT